MTLLSLLKMPQAIIRSLKVLEGLDRQISGAVPKAAPAMKMVASSGFSSEQCCFQSPILQLALKTKSPALPASAKV